MKSGILIQIIQYGIKNNDDHPVHQNCINIGIFFSSHDHKYKAFNNEIRPPAHKQEDH